MKFDSRDKVVSVSLFGSKQKYIVGSLKFVTSTQKYLPDWKIVFFVGPSVPQSHVELLESFGVSIIRINEPEGLSAASWRFRIWLLGNPGWIIFRDADSMMSLREARAVEQWVVSERVGHIIRDHPFHSAPILAGLWGLRGNFTDWFIEEVRSYSFNDTYGSDQLFLSQNVYPNIVGSVLVHANFHIHETKDNLGSFQYGYSRLGSFCGESITSSLIIRAYARLRRLLDPRECTCVR